MVKEADNTINKMQIPICVCGYTNLQMISLATIGVCVFVRLLRWAHFYFLGVFCMRKVDKLGRIDFLHRKKRKGVSEEC